MGIVEALPFSIYMEIAIVVEICVLRGVILIEKCDTADFRCMGALLFLLFYFFPLLFPWAPIPRCKVTFIPLSVWNIGILGHDVDFRC